MFQNTAVSQILSQYQWVIVESGGRTDGREKALPSSPVILGLHSTGMCWHLFRAGAWSQTTGLKFSGVSIAVTQDRLIASNALLISTLKLLPSSRGGQVSGQSVDLLCFRPFPSWHVDDATQKRVLFGLRWGSPLIAWQTCSYLKPLSLRLPAPMRCRPKGSDLTSRFPHHPQCQPFWCSP